MSGCQLVYSLRSAVECVDRLQTPRVISHKYVGMKINARCICVYFVLIVEVYPPVRDAKR